MTYRKSLLPVDAGGIRLPTTVTTTGRTMESYVGRVFKYEGRVWTVTSGVGAIGESLPLPRFWIAEYPDGSGERREVRLDELVSMLAPPDAWDRSCSNITEQSR